jgi:hypothetical protein
MQIIKPWLLSCVKFEGNVKLLHLTMLLDGCSIYCHYWLEWGVILFGNDIAYVALVLLP